MKEFLTDLLTKINYILPQKIENVFNTLFPTAFQNNFKQIMQNAVSSQTSLVFSGQITSGYSNTTDLSIALAPSYPANFSSNLPSFITSYNDSTKAMTFKKGCYIVTATENITGSFTWDSTEMAYAAISLQSSNDNVHQIVNVIANSRSNIPAIKTSIIYLPNDTSIYCTLRAALNTSTTTVNYDIQYEIVPLFYL